VWARRRDFFQPSAHCPGTTPTIDGNDALNFDRNGHARRVGRRGGRTPFEMELGQ